MTRHDPQSLGEKIALVQWRSRTFPVDPIAIAQSYGIRVEPDIDLPAGAFARASEVEGAKRIGYLLKESATRLRFAIAHCLGHHLLGHKTVPVESLTTFSSQSGSPDEADANRFALGLLVPTIALRHMVERKGVTRLQDIAAVFGVSEVAIKRRLMEADLI